MVRTQQHYPKSFSLLIKPTSADCNLNCEYCFYLEKHRIYPETKRHRMKAEVLEHIISSYMNTFQPIYYFGWQGGEPTLMGLEFFKKVVEYQKKYGRGGAIVSNGLQTNATLINDSLADLLSKYKFLVGVSIDGPKEMHDQYRKDINGHGSHADVLQGIVTLKRHFVEFNALVLVNSSNVQYPKEIFRYLCDLEICYHQYIPCVEFDNSGQPCSFAISGKQWGTFMCGIFDEWIRNDIRKVSVRLFDSILAHMIDWQYKMCFQGGRCNRYFVVEHNGDVYPCDFFVEPQKRLGNILNNPWEELIGSSKYRFFGRQKADWNNRCQGCDFLRFCSGDCLKHRYYNDKDPQTISWLCGGWKTFYHHTLSSFEKIALSLLNKRQAALPHRRRTYLNRLPQLEMRRGDLCFCGSEKRFKYCHEKEEAKNVKRSLI